MCYFDSLQTYDVFEPLKIKAFAIFTGGGGGGLVKDFRNAHAEEIVCARICEWYISKNSSICFKRSRPSKMFFAWKQNGWS